LKGLTILGATGSVGVSTLDVVERNPDRYRVVALTANRNDELLAQQCLKFCPDYAALVDPAAAQRLRDSLAASHCRTEVLEGPESLVELASLESVDAVMAAIVGAAGLLPTLAAAQAGKRVLLANKEALVMSGGLFMRAVRDNGALLLPIDSEHNAIFQCLPQQCQDDTTRNENVSTLSHAGVSRILLTGSGGPFRNMPPESLDSATPDQACAHPNWSMGRKISVDSATMMNKGLEVIEACWLFQASVNQVEVLLHPQSVIHSMVEYVDGSVLAQLGNPDMRTPIAHALSWPERCESGVSALDLIATGRLEFQAPDFEQFPCLALGYEAAHSGCAASAILNAANEVAVAAFLSGRIRFTDISRVIRECLERAKVDEPNDLQDVLNLDAEGRRLAGLVMANL
jgi:1-deoxy-D-xylulose-5-phosphate reductoisomerase